MIFTEGQSVQWHRSLRGGYGYKEIVPGVVRGMTAAGRIIVEVKKQDGSVVTRCVKATSLRTR